MVKGSESVGDCERGRKRVKEGGRRWERVVEGEDEDEEG